MSNKRNKLSAAESKKFIEDLKVRFGKNMKRHKDLQWPEIQKKLESQPAKLWSLNEMEITGGEPDVIGYDKKSQEFIFCDCSAESPKGRRSLCYDEDALKSRKEHKPANSAVSMADEMGVEIITEEQYRELQKIGEFDLKTSSWVKTPEEMREKGGAVFCDRRYGHVFLYHNGAESYYGGRGFRGMLRV